MSSKKKFKGNFPWDKEADRASAPKPDKPKEPEKPEK